jgi:hypothetical protein
MNKISIQKLALATGLALAPQCSVFAQHSHLVAGAFGTHQNDPLIWINAADFITSSSYVKTLEYTNASRYAGYFQGGITPIVAAATPAHAGPEPNAPALGSYIQFSLACLSGPAGGTFDFWEATGSVPALSLAPGQASTNLFRLSESDGSPGSDPYGHIHGRRFTATKPGLYQISFKLFDTSTNGVGGGPIHTPSAELPVWFQAGVNIVSVEPDYEEDHVHIRLAAPANTTWQLEASEQLGPHADWQPAGHPVTGADLMVERVHDSSPGTHRFYRLRRTAP